MDLNFDVLPRGPMNLKFRHASQRSDGFEFAYAIQRSDRLKFGRTSQRSNEILDMLPRGPRIWKALFIPMCVGLLP